MLGIGRAAAIPEHEHFSSARQRLANLARCADDHLDLERLELVGRLFYGWYDYDGTGHILTPKRRVYVVRGAEGELFAVQILSYYSDVGSSGWPKFTVKPL